MTRVSNWIRNLFPDSLSEVRVRNFERCVEDSPGTRIVDELPLGNGQELTIRLAPDSSTSSDLVGLLNNANVTITKLSTEEGAAYLEVRIE
ncbi:hypothetical protein [Halalkalicoccus ordinarius]|uniref:hypothetical protein n=1 Tax=Halalkalicoccus ordinarius TaxID=3116651 RepID=UPI00300F5153